MTSINPRQRRLSNNKALLFGAAASLLIILSALAGPYLAPYDIERSGTVDRVEQRLQGPSYEHLLGTDHLGTDVLSLVLNGAGNTLLIGVSAAAATTLVGLAAGLVSGYLGGTVDLFIMQIVDVFMAFPSLVLAILVAASLGPGRISILLALVLTGWA